MAKVQINSTWEMSIAPSIPALDLVAQHAENLSKEGVGGVFLSWSLGGYPSENLKLFQSFDGKMSANEAVESEPPSAGDSTTTTPAESPAIIRFRGIK